MSARYRALPEPTHPSSVVLVSLATCPHMPIGHARWISGAEHVAAPCPVQLPWGPRRSQRGNADVLRRRGNVREEITACALDCQFRLRTASVSAVADVKLTNMTIYVPKHVGRPMHSNQINLRVTSLSHTLQDDLTEERSALHVASLMH